MRPSEPHPPDVTEILKDKSAQTHIAVVGASNNPDKYGHTIVLNLQGKGYTVLPVNPKESTIAGLPAYPDLASLPQTPDIVNLVTPPPVTRKVLEQVAELGLPHVWLQDGSFDDEVLDYVAQAPFKTVYDACIMVMSNF